MITLLKKLTIASMLSVISAITYADHRYKVYSTTKEVSVLKSDTSEASQLHRDDFLDAQDVVILNSRQSISIQELESGLVYDCNTPGRYTVGTIIKEYKKRHPSLVASANAELLKHKDLKGLLVYSDPAAGYKSTEFYDSKALANLIFRNVIEPIASSAFKGAHDLVVEKERDERGLITLTVTNNTQTNLIINVIKVNIYEKNACLCLGTETVIGGRNMLVSYAVPAGETIKLDNCKFVSETSSCYVVIASKVTFDFNRVNSFLRSAEFDNCTSADAKLFYFSK